MSAEPPQPTPPADADIDEDSGSAGYNSRPGLLPTPASSSGGTVASTIDGADADADATDATEDDMAPSMTGGAEDCEGDGGNDVRAGSGDAARDVGSEAG
jgi:hypothetical protein